MAPKLYGTPRSHFTRIVRVVAHELSLPLAWVDVGNVGAAEAFGGNPLMQVPALDDDGHTIWGSDNVCRYLVERERKDPVGVTALDWRGRNLLSVIHGVMAAEVRLVLAERAGLSTDGEFFAKSRQTIRDGVAFVDTNLRDDGPLSYLQICAISMWDHLLLYDNAAPGQAPRIEALGQRLLDRASISQTRLA